MFYIAVSFTLFALLGGMHLLAKAQKEMLGKFFTWISYIIIGVSFLLLVCQATQGVIRMACHRGEYSECCMPGMMGGGWHHGGMGYGRCDDEKEEHEGKMGGKCCMDKEMKEGHCKGMEHEEEEHGQPDSLKK